MPDSKIRSGNELGQFSGTVVLVGAGKMGAAMLHGWLALGLAPARVVAIEPEPTGDVSALAARGLLLNPVKPVAGVAMIVLAIKPQVAEDVVPGLTPWIGPDTVIVSIMAGRLISSIEGALPSDAAVVRAMPNLPASVGRGITVAVPNRHVDARQRVLVDRFLAAVGSVEWVEDEALLDAVTAVSGSGPAYVFLLAEMLARAGATAGLPADLSARLARATVAGAGALLEASVLAPDVLRENVTSPGGTTAAALHVLMADDGLGFLLGQAVAAATKRSRELAK
jgi:pyrroline-5-carboxylate reductase